MGAKRVLVLGGAGFVGRHAVAALQALGMETTVGTRFPEFARARCAPNTAMLQVRMERIVHAHDWEPLLKEFDVVLNCVGILRQRFGERYEQIAHHAPAALAKACGKRGMRLIHVSALGLDGNISSRFLTSKRNGERALAVSNCDWVIVRPSLLEGRGGFGARWLHWVANWPMYCVPADALGRIAVLDVRDLGEALAKLASGLEPPSRTVELGGDHALTIDQLLAALRRRDLAPARVLRVPATLARLVAHLCDLLHVTPYSYGHLQLLRQDNMPKINHLREILGRDPRPLRAAGDEPAAA